MLFSLCCDSPLEYKGMMTPKPREEEDDGGDDVSNSLPFYQPVQHQ